MNMRMYVFVVVAYFSFIIFFVFIAENVFITFLIPTPAVSFLS